MEKNVDQRRSILAEVTHVFVTSLSNLLAHRRQDIFRLLMESIGQDECLWFAPIKLYDSVLLSATHKRNEETLKASLIDWFFSCFRFCSNRSCFFSFIQKALIDANEQMLNSFSQFSASTILVNLAQILAVVLNLPDQINSKTNTNENFVSMKNSIDLRSYTTKHIHVLKYQLLTFVSNVLAGELVVQMKKESLVLRKRIESISLNNVALRSLYEQIVWRWRRDQSLQQINSQQSLRLFESIDRSSSRFDVRENHEESSSTTNQRRITT